jgi:hypothetical protein
VFYDGVEGCPKEVHREMFSNKMILRKKEQMKP